MSEWKRVVNVRPLGTARTSPGLEAAKRTGLRAVGARRKAESGIGETSALGVSHGATDAARSGVVNDGAEGAAREWKGMTAGVTPTETVGTDSTTPADARMTRKTARDASLTTPA